MDQYRQILTHYEQTSLFLETLLRRSHFEEGRYVLEKRACNFKKQVIDLQLERYRPRFEERGIEVDTSMISPVLRISGSTACRSPRRRTSPWPPSPSCRDAFPCALSPAAAIWTWCGWPRPRCIWPAIPWAPSPP